MRKKSQKELEQKGRKRRATEEDDVVGCVRHKRRHPCKTSSTEKEGGEGRDEVDLFHPPPLAASRLSTGRRMGSSATRVACDAPEGQAEAADESRTTRRCNAEGRRDDTQENRRSWNLVTKPPRKSIKIPSKAPLNRKTTSCCRTTHGWLQSSHTLYREMNER